MRISLTDILSRFKRIPGPERPKDGPESVQKRDLQLRQGGNEPQEDAELAALSQELESLGTLAVPAAAKERTWPPYGRKCGAVERRRPPPAGPATTGTHESGVAASVGRRELWPWR